VRVRAKIEVELAYQASEEELEKITSLRCYFCGGRLRRTRTTYYSPLGIIVRNVPAFECEQCGEIYFDAETSRRLDALVKNTAKIIGEEEDRLATVFERR